MPYEIYYGCERPVSRPLHVIIAAEDSKSIRIEKNFLRIAAKAAKLFGMTKLTIQLVEKNEFCREETEWFSFEYIAKQNGRYPVDEISGPVGTICYPFDEIGEPGLNLNERTMVARIVKLVAHNRGYGWPLALLYDEEAARWDTHEGKGASALHDLLLAVRGMKDIDLEIHLSDAMKPQIPDDVIAGIADIIRNGNPFDRKNAGCGCPYRVTAEGCHACSRYREDMYLEYAGHDDPYRFNYDIEAKVRQGRAKAQKLLDRLAAEGEKTLCGDKAMKISEEALVACNMDRKTWNMVFELDHSSSRGSVLAVAVGLKLEWPALKEFMKIKGFAMDERVRLIDAVVAYFCCSVKPEIKEMYDVVYINSILAGLGSRDFLCGQRRGDNM